MATEGFGGLGAKLLKQMGWSKGEGLGKRKQGRSEPISVDKAKVSGDVTGLGFAASSRQPAAKRARKDGRGSTGGRHGHHADESFNVFDSGARVYVNEEGPDADDGAPPLQRGTHVTVGGLTSAGGTCGKHRYICRPARYNLC